MSITSGIIVDKVTTVSRSKIGSRIGRLAVEDMVRLNRAILVILSIAELYVAVQSW